MKLLDTQGRLVIEPGAVNIKPVANATPLLIDGKWNTTANLTAANLNVTEEGQGSGASSLLFDLQLGGASKWKCDKAGKVTQAGGLTLGGGLILPAGAASANSAPLKLTSGDLLSTTEAGTVEFKDDKLQFTITTGAGSSAARKRIAFVEDFTGIISTGRVFLSRLPNVATSITLVSGTAYFVYVGQTIRDINVNHVEFYVTTAGSGGQTAEVGIFKTPNAPNKTTQGTDGIVKLASVNSTAVDSLITLGLKRNNVGFNCNVVAGTHLWAGIRTAMATTQPALGGLCMDFSEGLVLSKASAGPLTDAGPWTGVLITVPTYLNTPIAPDLRVTMDPQ